jgi:hypothetical protein
MWLAEILDWKGLNMVWWQIRSRACTGYCQLQKQIFFLSLFYFFNKAFSVLYAITI